METAVIMAEIMADGCATAEDIQQALQIVEQRGNPIMVRTQFESELCRLIIQRKQSHKKTSRRTAYEKHYWAHIRRIERAATHRIEVLPMCLHPMVESCNSVSTAI